MLKPLLFSLVLILSTALAMGQNDDFNTERLPIGNSRTKYDFCAVKLNSVFDSEAGQSISVAELIQKLQTYRIVMLGETHTNEQHHGMQLKVIRGLVEAGVSVRLALEMFTPAQNAALERYRLGQISEQEFLEQSDYFNTWGHNYRYYKPIFDYAREKQIPMYGVNIEQSLVSKIGRSGIESLAPAERGRVPEIDTTDVEHQFYFKVAMEGMDAFAPSQFRKLYISQCLWDAAMGTGAIEIAQQHPESIVLILVGSGHVAYNLGIGKIIQKRSELPFCSVIGVDVPDTVKQSVMMQVKKSIKLNEKTVQRDTAKTKTPTITAMAMMHGVSADETPYRIVIRSLADFLWGLPQEKQEKYPYFGFSVDEKANGGFRVRRVLPETLAQRHGFQIGDMILGIDGQSFENMAQMKQYLSFKNWGDKVAFKIMREGKLHSIKFKIRP
ncbi:MAG: ChaN family lipoprotein [candidate division KSB1 bacterium]|nr:ChaN family lipoprotein [candidate division KSB1 bacterium]